MKTERIRCCHAPDAGDIELMHASYLNHRFPDHFHEEYSISVTLRGGLAFCQNGSKHVAPSGIISAVNPLDVHNACAAAEGEWAFRCFLIPVDVVKTLASESDGRDRLPAFRQRVIQDDGLAARLVALHRTLENSTDVLERQSLHVSILSALVHRHSTTTLYLPPARREHSAVRRTRDYLNDCYGQKVSLKQLAEVAGLSRFHFLRVFHEHTGLTPHVYLNQVRLIHAQRMLRAGLSTAEIALNCGFADQSHLARQFKQLLGVTPRRWRLGF